MTALPEVALPQVASPEVVPTAPVVWLAICRLDQLLPERGVAALVGDVQVAVFRLWDDEVLAVGNHDPFSHSNVISRGIVGRAGVTSRRSHRRCTSRCSISGPGRVWIPRTSASRPTRSA